MYKSITCLYTCFSTVCIACKYIIALYRAAVDWCAEKGNSKCNAHVCHSGKYMLPEAGQNFVAVCSFMPVPRVPEFSK